MLNQAETVVVSVTVILGVLQTLAVCLRLYCRVYQKVKVSADDYLMIVASFISTGIAILTDYVACTNDIGDQSHQPTLDAVVFALQVLGLAIVKYALVLFYKRIFVSGRFKIAANILLGIIVSFNLSIILVNIFDKLPVSDQWNPTVPYNVDVAALLIAFVSGNAALDVIILCLPLSVLRTLHVNTGRKLILGVIFSLGSITIVVTFLRLSFAVQYTKKAATGNSFLQVPFIYNILMALIELPVFIIATCLLSMGPLFRSKYGPINLFRSLQSRLLSDASRRKRENGRSTSGNLPIEDAAGVKQPWRRLDNAAATSSTERIRNEEWELPKVESTTSSRPATEEIA